MFIMFVYQDMKDYTDPALELYARKYKDIHPLPGLKNTQYISGNNYA